MITWNQHKIQFNMCIHMVDQLCHKWNRAFQNSKQNWIFFLGTLVRVSPISLLLLQFHHEIQYFFISFSNMFLPIYFLNLKTIFHYTTFWGLTQITSLPILMTERILWSCSKMRAFCRREIEFLWLINHRLNFWWWPANSSWSPLPFSF